MAVVESRRLSERIGLKRSAGRPVSAQTGRPVRACFFFPCAAAAIAEIVRRVRRD